MGNDTNKGTVLVSGASGFIGRHLTKTLITEGRNVIALVRNVRKFSEQFVSSKINNLKVLEADLADIKTLRNISEHIKGLCSLVHLGGYILRSSAYAKDYEANVSIDANIKGSYNLIKVLKPKLAYVCLISTSDVYGIPRYLPFNEEHPVIPANFYAASKLAMELYVAIELREAIPFSILRLAHVYGPGDPNPKVLQVFIDNIRAGKNPVIYGDGSDLRDYVHVSDVVKVIVQSLLLKTSGIFNVATGKSFSLKEMAEIAIKASGKELKPIFKERNQPCIDYSFDISKLKNEIGCPPQISIDQGVKELVNDIQSLKN